jgi:hypothetical protein
LYKDPANGTVMSNLSLDGQVEASTTALVITGTTAPTGLVFAPDLRLLRNAASDIKLLVESTVDVEISLQTTAGTVPSTYSVKANQTAVLTLGLIAGLPMVVGSHNFFDLATGGQADISGLTLHNFSYPADTLLYTGDNSGSAAATVELLPYQSVDLTLPVGPLDFFAVLSSHADLSDDPDQLAYMHLSATGAAYTGNMVGNQENSQALTANAGDVINLVNHGNSQMGISIAGGQTLYSRVNPALANAQQVYLHLVFAGDGSIADMRFIINPQPFEA